VDRFVLGRLESLGLAPAPEADRRTLVRRVFLDLLGVPPTPEEAVAFVRDPATDDDAWRSLVRRVLARPEHGERWARHWLDVARFAESSGFEHDYDRPHAYHYRDFVIRALNSDLPYDRFVQWQLAGDEFDPDNPEALMATGFLGAGVFPTQITANEVERTRYDAMDDMLSTTGTAFLGLTIGCARCHDHKSDPISSLEYYRMLATFTTTTRSELELDLDPAASLREREQFDREHAPLTAALREEETLRLPARFEAWLAGGASAPLDAAWHQPDFGTIPPVSAGGATLTRLDDGSYLATGKNPDHDRYTFTTLLPVGGEPVAAVRLEALADPSLPKGGPGRADNGNFALSRIRVLAGPVDGSADRPVELRLPRTTFEQNTNHLAVAASLDDNPRTGWAVDPRFGVSHAAAFEFATPLPAGAATRLTVVLEFEVNTRHQIGRPRIALSSNPRAALDAHALPSGVAVLLARLRTDPGSAAALSERDRSLLLAWWKPSDPEWRRRSDAVEAHRRKAPKPRLTKVLACVEGHTPVRMHTQGADFFPETHVLKRGSTDQKQGVASQGFLEVLTRASDPELRWVSKPPEGSRFSGRRRSLALWMTDTEHGAGHLLARVAVNRLWQHHFGTGLVATPNDFGAQGARPSHPELLDWLAGELIRNGWRLKPIHELLLTSAVYRQAALSPSEAATDRARALARVRATVPACPEPGRGGPPPPPPNPAPRPPHPILRWPRAPRPSAGTPPDGWRRRRSGIPSCRSAACWMPRASDRAPWTRRARGGRCTSR
jgi:hypothetical protein